MRCVELLKGATVRLENLKMCTHTKAQIGEQEQKGRRWDREAYRIYDCLDLVMGCAGRTWMMFGLGTLVCKNTGRNRRVGGRAVGGEEGEFSSILDKLHHVPGVGVSWRSAERFRHRADTSIPTVVVAEPRGE